MKKYTVPPPPPQYRVTNVPPNLKVAPRSLKNTVQNKN